MEKKRPLHTFRDQPSVKCTSFSKVMWLTLPLKWEEYNHSHLNDENITTPTLIIVTMEKKRPLHTFRDQPSVKCRSFRKVMWLMLGCTSNVAHCIKHMQGPPNNSKQPFPLLKGQVASMSSKSATTFCSNHWWPSSSSKPSHQYAHILHNLSHVDHKTSHPLNPKFWVFCKFSSYLFYKQNRVLPYFPWACAEAKTLQCVVFVNKTYCSPHISGLISEFDYILQNRQMIRSRLPWMNETVLFVLCRHI